MHTQMNIARNKKVNMDTERFESMQINRERQVREWENYDSQQNAKEGNTIKSSARSRKTVVNFQPLYLLMDAALNDEVEETRNQLDGRVDPNICKHDGLTPLHQAAVNRSVKMCQLLLDRGANPNSRDADDWTPLHAAAICGYLDICRVLIENGADLLAVNVDGHIPFDLTNSDEVSQYIQEQLTARGIRTSDLEAARSAPELCMYNEVLNLTKYNADLTELDHQGAAPIHIASSCGFRSVAELLLKNGVHPDLPDHEDWTPSHIAACWGQVEVLERLVAYGADFNLVTPQEKTVFMLCDDFDVLERVQDIWHRRETLRAAVRREQEAEEDRYEFLRAHIRRRSTLSVHRTSFREKVNLSRREALQEAELGRRAGNESGDYLKVARGNLFASNDDDVTTTDRVTVIPGEVELKVPVGFNHRQSSQVVTCRTNQFPTPPPLRKSPVEFQRREQQSKVGTRPATVSPSSSSPCSSSTSVPGKPPSDDRPGSSLINRSSSKTAATADSPRPNSLHIQAIDMLNRASTPVKRGTEETESGSPRIVQLKPKSRHKPRDRVMTLTVQQKCHVATTALDQFRGRLRRREKDFLRDELVIKNNLIQKLNLETEILTSELGHLKLKVEQLETSAEAKPERVDFANLKQIRKQLLEQLNQLNVDLPKVKINCSQCIAKINACKAQLSTAINVTERSYNEVKRKKALIAALEKEATSVLEQIEEERQIKEKITERYANYKAPSLDEFIAVNKERYVIDKMLKNVRRRCQVSKVYLGNICS